MTSEALSKTIKIKSVWRFWNKNTSEMEYGLGQAPSSYENYSYIAMRRIVKANPHGGEIFDGDIIRFENDTRDFRMDPDGDLHASDGTVLSMDNSVPYVVVKQDPLDAMAAKSRHLK